MQLQFISFFGVFLLMLTLILVYLWFSANTFFNITASRTRFIFLLVLFFLTWSFPVSMFIERVNESVISRGYYFFSAAWVGVLIHLIIATVPVWLVLLITKYAKVKFDIKTVAIVFFLLAIVYATYGLYNARNTRIKNVEVPIKNLTAEWEGKKIIQLSDLHLGALYGRGFLEKIVQKVNAENPEIIFITGDLFDGMDGSTGTLVGALNSFKAKQGVYFVTGNHESYLGLDRALDILKQTDIKILDDRIIDLNGLQIIGLSYPEFGTTKDIKTVIRPGENFFSDKPSILLYHAPTNIELNGTSSHTSAYWKPDMNFSYAKNLGINLQLSGHAHAGQFFPFTLFAYFIYSGYDYGLHTDGGFSIYVTSGIGTWGPPMRTFNNPEIVEIELVSKK
jgi:uncharacterized protein